MVLRSNMGGGFLQIWRQQNLLTLPSFELILKGLAQKNPNFWPKINPNWVTIQKTLVNSIHRVKVPKGFHFSIFENEENEHYHISILDVMIDIHVEDPCAKLCDMKIKDCNTTWPIPCA